MAFLASCVAAFAVIFMFPTLLKASSNYCSKQLDINVVLEIAHGQFTQLTTASKVIQSMVRFSDYNCTRFSVTIAWKRVDVITTLDCNYQKNARTDCLPTALRRLADIERKEHTTPQFADGFTKETLIKAIKIGYDQLLSGSGARPTATKYMILILSNPPEPGVISTADAVKDLHDHGIEIEVVGVGNGRQEPLKHIVNHYNEIFVVADLEKLVDVIPSVIVAVKASHRSLTAVEDRIDFYLSDPQRLSLRRSFTVVANFVERFNEVADSFLDYAKPVNVRQRPASLNG